MRHAASPALRRQIVESLRAHDARATPAPPTASWRPWLNIAVGFACGAVATWLLFMLPVNADPAERTENEVIAAHARSLMVAHATDVASSDQHTVKPWLSAHLDFSPPVPDLSGDGFPLTGGRLDYVSGRPVAALLYMRHQHVINVFVWPAPEAASASPRSASRKGFNTIAWQQGGMQYWVVTDLGNGELSAFTQLLRQRATETRAP
jgi:anti-sigma factor RsiW